MKYKDMMKNIFLVFDKINKNLDDEKEIKIVESCFNNSCLKEGFLKVSDEKPKTIFKKYCKKNNIDVDWKKIKNNKKVLDYFIGTLKNKYKRPRPKKILAKKNKKYEKIKNMTSYSFPSGHTAGARFIAELLANDHPKYASDFFTLSDLIGQSRLENGVHYETDVLWGKYLGEQLANTIIK